MVVQMLDLVPEIGAGPGARPKNFEILKFDDLADFKVFSVINAIDIKYD